MTAPEKWKETTKEWKAIGRFLQTNWGREEKRQSLEIWVEMKTVKKIDLEVDTLDTSWWEL